MTHQPNPNQKSNKMKSRHLIRNYCVCSKLPYSPDIEIISARTKNDAKREYKQRHASLKWTEIQASECD